MRKAIQPQKVHLGAKELNDGRSREQKPEVFERAVRDKNESLRD